MWELCTEKKTIAPKIASYCTGAWQYIYIFFFNRHLNWIPSQMREEFARLNYLLNLYSLHMRHRTRDPHSRTRRQPPPPAMVSWSGPPRSPATTAAPPDARAQSTCATVGYFNFIICTRDIHPKHKNIKIFTNIQVSYLQNTEEFFFFLQLKA